MSWTIITGGSGVEVRSVSWDKIVKSSRWAEQSLQPGDSGHFLETNERGFSSFIPDGNAASFYLKRNGNIMIWQGTYGEKAGRGWVKAYIKVDSDVWRTRGQKSNSAWPVFGTDLWQVNMSFH